MGLNDLTNKHQISKAKVLQVVSLPSTVLMSHLSETGINHHAHTTNHFYTQHSKAIIKKKGKRKK
ncbi:hypothetical protein QG37_06730 [Candidozyma auris]|uniref:Uncharacterized protein n=1 Tax=Candidozyma auris TaxID=498019 RepID=A0A0L0NT61_CANAR|nr:hypothetical protein QG37_06730 [[Candida] auris]